MSGDRALREIDHPYYGAEGIPVEFGDVDELIENVRDTDADMNHVYRWDWDVYEADESGPASETLTLFVVQPRKSRLVSWSAPVTRDDDAKVCELLASDRVLGSLRKMWEPFL